MEHTRKRPTHFDFSCRVDEDTPPPSYEEAVAEKERAYRERGQDYWAEIERMMHPSSSSSTKTEEVTASTSQASRAECLSTSQSSRAERQWKDPVSKGQKDDVWQKYVEIKRQRERNFAFTQLHPAKAWLLDEARNKQDSAKSRRKRTRQEPTEICWQRRSEGDDPVNSKISDCLKDFTRGNTALPPVGRDPFAALRKEADIRQRERREEEASLVHLKKLLLERQGKAEAFLDEAKERMKTLQGEIALWAEEEEYTALKATEELFLAQLARFEMEKNELAPLSAKVEELLKEKRQGAEFEANAAKSRASRVRTWVKFRKWAAKEQPMRREKGTVLMERMVIRTALEFIMDHAMNLNAMRIAAYALWVFRNKRARRRDQQTSHETSCQSPTADELHDFVVKVTEEQMECSSIENATYENGPKAPPPTTPSAEEAGNFLGKMLKILVTPPSSTTGVPGDGGAITGQMEVSEAEAEEEEEERMVEEEPSAHGIITERVSPGESEAVDADSEQRT